MIALQMPRDVPRYLGTLRRILGHHERWVPPLRFERRRFFDPSRNPWFQRGEAQLFLLPDRGVISAHRHRSAPERGTIGFFDFVDDRAVSSALLEAARAWLAARGCTTIHGPASFGNEHAYGVLVDGFDQLPAVGNAWNPPYYEAHYRALGFAPEEDWYAYEIGREPVSDRFVQFNRRLFARRPDLRIEAIDPNDEGRYHEIFRQIYNRSFHDLPGHTPLSADEYAFLVEGMRQVVDPDLVLFAFAGDQPAAASITLPDVAPVLKRMNGSLLPFGWLTWLRRARYVSRIHIFALGVMPEFQHLPLGVPLYAETWRRAYDKGMQGAEASLVAARNVRMRGAVERAGMRIIQTYRTFARPL